MSRPRGFKLSRDHKNKIGNALRGRKYSDRAIKNMSEGMKRKWQDPKYRTKQLKARKGRVPWNKGLNAQTDSRVRAQAEKLTKLPKSQAPPSGFRYLAQRLCKERGKCWCCGETEKRLEVHHRDGNRLNCDKSNLEVLCCGCHQRLTRLFTIVDGLRIPPYARARFTKLVRVRYPEYDISKLVYISGKL